MPLSHLLNQIVKQRLCNICVISRQRRTVAECFILLHYRHSTCSRFCKFFCQHMLCRDNNKPSAFSLENSRNTEIPHIHIAIIQEIIRLLIVIFASGCNFFLIKRTLGWGNSSSLAQIKNPINNLIQIITGISGMSPQCEFDSAQFRRTGSPLKFQHDCQEPS